MLTIENLDKTFYPGTAEQHTIFHDFNLETNDRECVAILGPNGCGKSTLFNLITGSLQHDNGKISLEEIEISKLPEEERSKFIGRVMQDPSMGVSPSLTIMENIFLAERKGKTFGFNKLYKDELEEAIYEKLKSIKLGLEQKINTQVQFLSGGQRQTISLLMATFNHPKLLLLDEHTAALDPKTSRLILEKTRELIDRDHIMTLMITHDLRTAIDFADRIVMLNQGQVVLDIPGGAMSEEELSKIYNEKIEQGMVNLVS